MPNDDDLVIRYTRLCECGLPAGHSTACKPGRLAASRKIDDAVQAAITERASARFTRRRREFDTTRRANRAGMDDLALHQWIVQQAARMSTVGAAAVGRSSPSSDHTRIGPGHQQQLTDDPRWRECQRVLRWKLQQMADLIDEQQGHGTIATTANMIGAEKDRLIVARDNEGLTARAVVEKLGAHIAGSAETVRRKRRENDLDALGYPRDRAS